MSFRVSFASVMRKIASYLTKNRSETGRKIAQSTHENEYIKQEKTFCRNSKQFLNSFLSITDSISKLSEGYFIFPQEIVKPPYISIFNQI